MTSLHCTEFEKGKIIALLESGQSIAQVAHETGRCRQTIAKWRKRHEEEGEPGMAKRHSTGRPRKTTAEQDAAMVEVSSRNVIVAKQTNGLIIPFRFLPTPIYFSGSVNIYYRYGA